MDWMDLVRAVLWDCKRITMTMWVNGEKVVLKGVGRNWGDPYT